MDNTILENRVRPEFFTLENVLIIDFIKAIKLNDYTIIHKNCTEHNFNILYIDYIDALNSINKSGIQKQIELLSRDYNIVLKLGLYLNHTYNKEMLYILKNEFNYDIDDEYTGDDIKKILDKNELILKKIKLLNSRIPKKNNNDSDNSIYDTIAIMSNALGFDLDYDKLTVVKFIAYTKQLIKQSKDE